MKYFLSHNIDDVVYFSSTLLLSHVDVHIEISCRYGISKPQSDKVIDIESYENMVQQEHAFVDIF